MITLSVPGDWVRAVPSYAARLMTAPTRAEARPAPSFPQKPTTELAAASIRLPVFHSL